MQIDIIVNIYLRELPVSLSGCIYWIQSTSMKFKSLVCDFNAKYNGPDLASWNCQPYTNRFTLERQIVQIEKTPENTTPQYQPFL